MCSNAIMSRFYRLLNQLEKMRQKSFSEAVQFMSLLESEAGVRMSSAYRTVNRVRAVNDLRSDRVSLMHFITGVCFQQVYRSLSSDVFCVGLNNQLELCNIQISRATCFYYCKICHNILKFTVQTRREHSGLLQTSVKKKI